jgi:glycosyltransferase involved in cell wall biosynthesis
MKVAVVLYGYTPEVGGGYTFQRTLVDSLERLGPSSGHEFTYFVAGGGEMGPPGSVTIPWTRRSVLRRRLIEFVRGWQDRVLGVRRVDPQTWFERESQSRGIDVVWFASNYAEDCDQPFIFTIWDIQHLLQPWFPEVSARGEWERRHAYFTRHLLKATRVIVPNEAGRDQLMRFFPIGDERVVVAPHPTPAFALADHSHGEDPGRVMSAHDLSHPYLLYPAQFWAHKNHFTLLRMLAELERTAPGRFSLVCVGSDKGRRGFIEQVAAELGVGERLRVLGFVPTEELVALYRGAHALVYPTFFGPENLPPMEAFGLGCPVIASAIPGATEQLGDAALLVEPLDAAGFADAVHRLEDPALREQMIERGRRRATDASGDEYVRRVIEALDDLGAVRRTWQ